MNTRSRTFVTGWCLAACAALSLVGAGCGSSNKSPPNKGTHPATGVDGGTSECMPPPPPSCNPSDTMQDDGSDRPSCGDLVNAINKPAAQKQTNFDGLYNGLNSQLAADAKQCVNKSFLGSYEFRDWVGLETIYGTTEAGAAIAAGILIRRLEECVAGAAAEILEIAHWPVTAGAALASYALHANAWQQGTNCVDCGNECVSGMNVCRDFAQRAYDACKKAQDQLGALWDASAGCQTRCGSKADYDSCRQAFKNNTNKCTDMFNNCQWEVYRVCGAANCSGSEVGSTGGTTCYSDPSQPGGLVKYCGSHTDSCGVQYQCGMCPNGQTCNGLYCTDCGNAGQACCGPGDITNLYSNGMSCISPAVCVNTSGGAYCQTP